MNMKDEHILVTGAAGLLGSRFIEYLIDKNHVNKDKYGIYNGVIGIDALEPWGNDKVVNNVEIWRLDLSQPQAPQILDQLFSTHNIKYVYHFASYAAEGLSYFMRTFNYMHNTIATSNIINACIKHGVEKLIYTSSMSVYGDNQVPYTEDQRPSPQDPYAISKYCCEQDIQMANKYFGLNYTIIRPHNVFGRNQNMNDTYRNVLGIWMHQIWDGQPITIYGDGEQRRNFTEMSNILDSLYQCMYNSESDNQIVNLGGIENQSLNELAEMVLSVTGTNQKIYLEPRKEVKFCKVDPQKSIDIFNYSDKLTVYDGIKNMWQWVQEEQPIHSWYQWNTFELDKGIYSYWQK